MTTKIVLWGIVFLSSLSMGAGPAKDNWPTTKVTFAFARKHLINNENCYKTFEKYFGCVAGLNRMYDEETSESRKLFPNSIAKESVEFGSVVTEYDGFSLANVNEPEFRRKTPAQIKALLKKEREITLGGWRELFNGKEGPDFNAVLDDLQEKHKTNPKNPYLASLILNGYLSVAGGPHSMLLPKPDARAMGLSVMYTPPKTSAEKSEPEKKGPPAILKLADFLHPSAYALFERTLNDLKKKNVSGITLDLRGNPGGDATLALQILSLFYPKNTTLIATHKVQRNGDAEIFAPLLDLGSRFLPTATLAMKADALQLPEWFDATTWRDGMYDGPLVVLIDEKSASGSELVASAVQEVEVNGKPRGVVVGTRSFGKGTAQTPETWELDSKVVFLRTAFFFMTPGGFSPHVVGVTPDITAGINPFVNENLLFHIREENLYDWNLEFPHAQKPKKTSDYIAEIQKCVAKNGKAKEKFKEFGFFPGFDYQGEVANDTLACLSK